ncbi:MAG: RNA polymerase sigma factor [Candidatus Acidiferrum sp.]
MRAPPQPGSSPKDPGIVIGVLFVWAGWKVTANVPYFFAAPGDATVTFRPRPSNRSRWHFYERLTHGAAMTPFDGASARASTGAAPGPNSGHNSGNDWVRSLGPMYMDKDLETLMARYQQGDHSAATALIHRLSPQLHRFFIVQFASRGDADDLLQETWLRIHKVRHTYRPGEPVLPWFYAIARHIRVDHYRKAIRTAAREQRLEETHEVASKPAAASKTPDLAALLEPLPNSQREVIEMLKVAGMSLEEVARATSSSVGSVKQKAHRAYERLRERLTAMGLGSDRKGGLS